MDAMESNRRLGGVALNEVPRCRSDCMVAIHTFLSLFLYTKFYFIIMITVIIEYLLWIRYCSRFFLYIISNYSGRIV